MTECKHRWEFLSGTYALVCAKCGEKRNGDTQVSERAV